MASCRMVQSNVPGSELSSYSILDPRAIFSYLYPLLIADIRCYLLTAGHRVIPGLELIKEIILPESVSSCATSEFKVPIMHTTERVVKSFHVLHSEYSI